MENNQEVTESPSMMTYAIGALLVVAVIAGAWYFRTRNANEQTTGTPVAVVSPTPGPISGLACDLQYFNPKIGFPEYYLSVEGGDVTNATNVSCTFTANVDGKSVATATAQSPLTSAPQRNGNTFRCTTDAVKLTPNTPTTIDVALKDNLGASSTCSAAFTFPSP